MHIRLVRCHKTSRNSMHCECLSEFWLQGLIGSTSQKRADEMISFEVLQMRFGSFNCCEHFLRDGEYASRKFKYSNGLDSWRSSSGAARHLRQRTLTENYLLGLFVLIRRGNFFPAFDTGCKWQILLPSHLELWGLMRECGIAIFPEEGGKGE